MLVSSKKNERENTNGSQVTTTANHESGQVRKHKWKKDSQQRGQCVIPERLSAHRSLCCDWDIVVFMRYGWATSVIFSPGFLNTLPWLCSLQLKKALDILLNKCKKAKDKAQRECGRDCTKSYKVVEPEKGRGG